MQMIWLLRVLVPAKKVHFNLNGSELRGFPIKARSGHSNILYANPLAPNAEVCSYCHYWRKVYLQQLSVKEADSYSVFSPVSIPVIRTGWKTHSQIPYISPFP